MEMERKTFSRGLDGAEKRLVSSPCHAPAVQGQKGEVVLGVGWGECVEVGLHRPELLCSRCCFLIGNSVSNKAFHFSPASKVLSFRLQMM